MSWPTSVFIVVVWMSESVSRATPKSSTLGRAIDFGFWILDFGLPDFVPSCPSAFLFDEDIARLQIAVNHPLLMGVADGVADPDQQCQSIPRREIVMAGVLG